MSAHEILNKIVKTTLRKPVHEAWKIRKDLIPHPLKMGFYTSIGDPYGQIADYRVALTDGRGIHSREYKDFYTFHWDNKDPSLDFWGHWVEDAPHWFIILGIGTTTVGAICWKIYGSRGK